MEDLDLLVGEEMRQVHVPVLRNPDILPRHLANECPGWFSKSVATAGGIPENQDPQGVIVLQQLPGQSGARLDGAQPSHVISSLGQVKTWEKQEEPIFFTILSTVPQTRDKEKFNFL
jgi:hypothetical protein